MWWMIPLGVIVMILLIVLIRALLFVPKKTVKPNDCTVEFDSEKAITSLQELVRCKTVSKRNHKGEDAEEFEKLIGLLPTLYPNVFEACTLKRFPDWGLLFHWKGKNSTSPAVLMAHYDVVPVHEEMWDKPAFDAIIENDRMWGRGTLDTKVTMNAVLLAADTLIGQGFVPNQDIYFAFSGGEEVDGLGAKHIVDWFASQGITPAMVLDEGGAVVEKVFPGVDAPCAMVGIAEKGIVNVRYRICAPGGHASAPSPNASIDRLAKACCRILKKPFPYHITEPAAALFDTLGRHSQFFYRMIFANLWLFSPILNAICKASGGDLNALMRTTVAFTQMSGSKAANVLPSEAEMVCNIRINPKDSVNSVLARLRRIVKDDDIEISAIAPREPSRISRSDGTAWEMIESSIASTWGCLVSPYLMVQASDSWFYDAICNNVYRFSALALTSQERDSIHGNNEHIRIESVGKAVEFYIRFMKQW